MNSMNKFDSTGRTPLDDQLDAALAKYAAVEPRTGLEERILANLKSQPNSSTGMSGWRWAVVAATLLVTSLLLWRIQEPKPQHIVRRPASSQEKVLPQAVAKITSPSSTRPIARAVLRKARKPVSTRPALAQAVPKLDQFPAPQPLSEQEKILMSYISHSRDQAVLVARARTEALKKDREEEERDSDAIKNSQAR